MFAGGESDVGENGAIGTVSNAVDVFKSDGTKHTSVDATVPRTRGTMTPLGATVLYAGGNDGTDVSSYVFKIYLNSNNILNTSHDVLSQAR